MLMTPAWQAHHSLKCSTRHHASIPDRYRSLSQAVTTATNICCRLCHVLLNDLLLPVLPDGLKCFCCGVDSCYGNALLLHTPAKILPPSFKLYGLLGWHFVNIHQHLLDVKPEQQEDCRGVMPGLLLQLQLCSILASCVQQP